MTSARDDWLDLLRRTADSVTEALSRFKNWTEAGDRPDQYALDKVADAAVLSVLVPAGVGVLSEESGLRAGSRSETVIVDPVDGSTNASRRIPHYSISLCVVDEAAPLAGLVRHLVSGEEFTAVAGEGAWLDGRPISPSGCNRGAEAIVGVSGRPGERLPASQVRVLGSAALDLCAVACGRLDAYVDLNDNHGVWDYAAGVLICAEAGAFTAATDDNELFHLEHSRRLGPMAASTPQFGEELRSYLSGHRG